MVAELDEVTKSLGISVVSPFTPGACTSDEVSGGGASKAASGRSWTALLAAAFTTRTSQSGTATLTTTTTTTTTMTMTSQTASTAAAKAGASRVLVAVCGQLNEGLAAATALQLHLQDVAEQYYASMLLGAQQAQEQPSGSAVRAAGGATGGRLRTVAKCPAALPVDLALELVRDPGLPSECLGRVHEATCADVVAEAAVAEASVATAVAAMAVLDS
ncbi:hypothetical protein HXX76_005719 [Chlamydomonas incerta]|uniref:Uncharacterized protein n=1 Tax=Chlamydomonas incerta TaxID=51695 RepID=A0A835TI28_CHLIN|nr:hypothetical protein HXX76_005719 [Chlamydomonas incerta]|eukprot:KAG2438110.1 hypothetical protein HXX76_005719 [Chlamydomonas incerta]